METSTLQTKSRSKTSATRSSSRSESDKNEYDLQSRIQVAAYYKAQSRGFVPGYELEDWLSAEKEENR